METAQQKRFQAYAAWIEAEFDGPRGNPDGAKQFFSSLSTRKLYQMLAVLPIGGKLAQIALAGIETRP